MMSDDYIVHLYWRMLFGVVVSVPPLLVIGSGKELVGVGQKTGQQAVWDVGHV
jgi:hypothetical protein